MLILYEIFVESEIILRSDENSIYTIYSNLLTEPLFFSTEMNLVSLVSIIELNFII